MWVSESKNRYFDRVKLKFSLLIEFITEFSSYNCVSRYHKILKKTSIKDLKMLKLLPDNVNVCEKITSSLKTLKETDLIQEKYNDTDSLCK